MSRLLIWLHQMNDRHDPTPNRLTRKSSSSPSRTSRGCRPRKRRTMRPTSIGSSAGSRDPGSPSGPNHAGYARRCPPFATCAGSCGRSPGGRIATSGQRARRSPPSTAVMREGLHYHVLRATDDGARFDMSQVGDDLDQARSAIAGSLAHYLAEHDLDRLGVCATRRAAGSSWTAHPVDGAGGATWEPAEPRESRPSSRPGGAPSPGFRGAPRQARISSRRYARPMKPTSRHVRIRGRRFQTSRRRTSEWARRGSR